MGNEMEAGFIGVILGVIVISEYIRIIFPHALLRASRFGAWGLACGQLWLRN